MFIVMWEIQQNSADQDYFKILILQETWKNQNQHQVESYALLEVIDNAKQAMILWTITEPCSNREFLREDWKNYHSLKRFIFPHGRMTWWVMQRSVWNDIVSWQTRLHNNSIRYLLPASMTTTSKKKKQNLLENCQIHALKLF